MEEYDPQHKLSATGRSFRHLLRQNLEGDIPTRLAVLGTADLTHASPYSLTAEKLELRDTNGSLQVSFRAPGQ